MERGKMELRLAASWGNESHTVHLEVFDPTTGDVQRIDLAGMFAALDAKGFPPLPEGHEDTIMARLYQLAIDPPGKATP